MAGRVNTRTTRRQFLAAGTAAALGLLAGARPARAQGFKTKLQRAVIIGKPDEQTLRELKDAGFDGIETNAILPDAEAQQCRALAEKIGLRIHSVLLGGGTREKAEAAMRAAHAYGADAILYVPGRISGLPLPQPWEFDVRFDEATGHLRQVVAGDNAPYARYIAEHDRATDTAVATVKQLVPLAGKLGVTVGLENVWNNLWVRPEHFKWLVAAGGSPWVKAYFDVGNHVKYPAPPEEWIRVLGKQIAKVHIKDYKLAADRHNGKFVHPREGSIQWPAVRRALEDVGYNGWLTVEDGGLAPVEFRRRLDEIIAGR